MKKNGIATITLAGVLFCSCMNDKEYQLRMKQLENQANHPATYDVLSIEGKVTIEVGENGKVRVTQPNQPFKEVDIPNGIKTQEALVKYLISAGVITVLGYKSLQGARSNKTYNTTNNNYAAQP